MSDVDDEETMRVFCRRMKKCHEMAMAEQEEGEFQQTEMEDATNTGLGIADALLPSAENLLPDPGVNLQGQASIEGFSGWGKTF